MEIDEKAIDILKAQREIDQAYIEELKSIIEKYRKEIQSLKKKYDPIYGDKK